MRSARFVGLVLAVACSTERAESTSFASLIDMENWAPLSASEDPFASAGSQGDASTPPGCGVLGFTVEQGMLEIDTGRCGFMTLEQPALEAVHEGQLVLLTLSHFDLTAPEPAEGVAALALGSCVVWSKTVPIPRAAEVYEEKFVSDCELDRGDPVLFHLHNHGQNNWQLARVEVER